MYNAKRSATIISRAFCMYKCVSGLSANVTNNLAIPLWDLQDCRNNQHTGSLKALFLGFKLANFGKYLGFQTGLAAHGHAWQQFVDPFIDSVRQVRSFGLGLIASICLYNMLCFSKLASVAQCYTPDKVILDAEKKGTDSACWPETLTFHYRPSMLEAIWSGHASGFSGDCFQGCHVESWHLYMRCLVEPIVPP
jgi:hypothetical protein